MMKKVDKRGRVTLPPSFADSFVIIESVNDAEIRIIKVRAIPEKEFALLNNPDVLKQVLTGIEQAKQGLFVKEK